MTRQPTTLLYLVKQVELAVRAGLDEVVRPTGITTPQFTALTVLERHPGMTSATLARHSFVTAQSMSDVVNALLSRGLIDRHRDPEDRRRLGLALTDEGRQLLAECRDAVADLETTMLRGLDPATVQQLRSGLEGCRNNLTVSTN